METTEGTVTRKKRYEPEDKDYELSNIGIDDAENGVVITCRYRLKEDVKEKMRKMALNGGPSPSFYEYENNDEKHVFENRADAMKFINDELAGMWG